MKLFLLDIGNTNTRCGLMEDGILIESYNFPTSKIEELELPSDMPVAASSVVPEAERKLRDRDIFWVDYKKRLNIRLEKGDVEELGADRIANLVALTKISNLPAIMIDCGTAITGELISSDRVFLGGPIAPGRLLLRRALSDYTALLPFVSLEKGGAKSFGLTTDDAIIIGTDLMIVGAAKEFIYSAKRLLGYENLDIFIAGGDRQLLLDDIPEAKAAPKDITLIGIAAIWEMNN